MKSKLSRCWRSRLGLFLRFCGRSSLRCCRWWWGWRRTLPDTRACGRSLPCCWWISCRCCWCSHHMNSDRDSDRHFLTPKQRLNPVLSCPVKKKQNIRFTWTCFVYDEMCLLIITILTKNKYSQYSFSNRVIFIYFIKHIFIFSSVLISLVHKTTNVAWATNWNKIHLNGLHLD